MDTFFLTTYANCIEFGPAPPLAAPWPLLTPSPAARRRPDHHFAAARSRWLRPVLRPRRRGGRLAALRQWHRRRVRLRAAAVHRHLHPLLLHRRHRGLHLLIQRPARHHATRPRPYEDRPARPARRTGLPRRWRRRRVLPELLGDGQPRHWRLWHGGRGPRALPRTLRHRGSGRHPRARHPARHRGG